jgi:hypothetical protein
VENRRFAILALLAGARDVAAAAPRGGGGIAPARNRVGDPHEMEGRGEGRGFGCVQSASRVRLEITHPTTR